MVHDLQQLPMLTPKPTKEMLPEQPLPQVLPMLRPMPLQDPTLRI